MGSNLASEIEVEVELEEPLAEQSRERLPFTFAQSNGVLLNVDTHPISVVHRQNLSLCILLEVQRFLKRPFQMQEVSDEAFQRLLTSSYQRDNNEAVQMAEELGDDIDLSRLADEIPEASDLMDSENDAPVIRLINAILSQAVREQASDIHIETFEERLIVRFRVDGVMREVLSPKRMLAPLLISRLKVMAKLDIAEKRIPQDGRISIKLAGHAVDIRVSTLPSVHNERVVLRLLDKQAGQLQLDQLRMNDQVLHQFEAALASPHGIVLVTGPTGSGKTTTLYAGLTEINDSSRNILTIEDPVEYLLPGIGQTQVNTKVDMTFARGLRAILRQDPDVMMVGEIRDIETADIAVQASLTGHLVLSTLHTNTAVGAITRLRDMGVEPFLLSSSLIMVMAQRLVRLLCPDCKEGTVASAAECQHMSVEPKDDIKVCRPVGCEHCNQSGYRGRTGIYEVIDINDQLRRMIHDDASEQDMLEVARQHSKGILENGWRRVLAGDTSIAEVLRVNAAHG